MGRRTSKFKSDRLRFYWMIDDLYVTKKIEVTLTNSFEDDRVDYSKQHIVFIHNLQAVKAFNNDGKQIDKIAFYIKKDIKRITSIIAPYNFYLLPSSGIDGVYYLVPRCDI